MMLLIITTTIIITLIIIILIIIKAVTCGKKASGAPPTPEPTSTAANAAGRSPAGAADEQPCALHHAVPESIARLARCQHRCAHVDAVYDPLHNQQYRGQILASVAAGPAATAAATTAATAAAVCRRPECCLQLQHQGMWLRQQCMGAPRTLLQDPAPGVRQAGGDRSRAHQRFRNNSAWHRAQGYGHATSSSSRAGSSDDTVVPAAGQHAQAGHVGPLSQVPAAVEHKDAQGAVCTNACCRQGCGCGAI